MNINWAAPLSPAQATRGSWGVIQGNDLSSVGYPTSGEGKFAQFVYIVGGTLGAGATAQGTNIVYPNTLYNASTALYNKAYVFTPPATITKLEVYNNTSNLVYFMPIVTNHATLTAQGMPINASTYYSLDTRDVSQFTMCATPSADIRVFGHYRS